MTSAPMLQAINVLLLSLLTTFTAYGPTNPSTPHLKLMAAEPRPGKPAHPLSPCKAGDTAAEARSLRKSGRLEEAIGQLKAARGGAPQDLELLGLLGLCLLDAGRQNEALVLLGETHDAPRDIHVLELFRGRLAFEQGDTATAIAHLETAAESPKRPVEALVNLVRAHAQEESFVRAATVAEQLESWQEALGKRLGAQMAEAAGDRIMQRAGRNVEALPRALEKFEAALAKDPTNDLLARKVYDTLVLNHRSTSAFPLLDRLFPEVEGSTERDFQTGRCRVIAGDMKGAEEAFRKALAASPNRSDAAIELARILLSGGHTDEVVQLLSPFAQRGGSHSDVQMLLGLAYERSGHYAEAETFFRRARKLSPQQMDILYHLGRVLIRAGKAEEGRKLLSEFQKATG